MSESEYSSAGNVHGNAINSSIDPDFRRRAFQWRQDKESAPRFGCCQVSSRALFALAKVCADERVPRVNDPGVCFETSR